MKSAVATTVLLPLCLTEQATALGITAALLGDTPAVGVRIWLSWRILHTRTEPATRPHVQP